MKLNGFVGKGTGKLGSSVFAVSGGEQIVRQYNPNVSNPSTDAQVEQRAKLKLMSQIAAVLRDAIAFKKNGLVSARNQFISANIGLCTFANGKAELDLTAITLTGKVSVLPPIVAAFDQQENLGIELESDATAKADAVVYVCTSSNPDMKLLVEAIKVVSTPGENGKFQTSIAGLPSSIGIYAYGVKFSSAAQKVRYENYITNNEPTGAKLSINALEALKAGEPTETKYVLAEV